MHTSQEKKGIRTSLQGPNAVSELVWGWGNWVTVPCPSRAIQQGSTLFNNAHECLQLIWLPSIELQIVSIYVPKKATSMPATQYHIRHSKAAAILCQSKFELHHPFQCYDLASL
eukprot:313826-Amphidinium_carterae.2